MKIEAILPNTGIKINPKPNFADVEFYGPPGCGKTRSMLVNAVQIMKEYSLNKIYVLDGRGKDISLHLRLNTDNLDRMDVEHIEIHDFYKNLPKDMLNSILLIEDNGVLQSTTDWIKEHVKVMPRFIFITQQTRRG